MGVTGAERELFRTHLKNNFNIPIRILLDSGQRAATIHSPSDALYLRFKTPGGWVRLGREAHVEIRRLQERMQFLVNGIFFPSSDLYFRGGVKKQDAFDFEGAHFRGALKASIYDDKIMITNVLPLEDYLVATVAGEMSPSWEKEVLKAQVVASRSYALYMIRHPRHSLYDVEKSIEDQVYKSLKTIPASVTDAITLTSGQYLATDTEPIKAFFHSRCGGTTETAESVWNQKGSAHKNRVPCAYCRRHPYRWSLVLGIEDLIKSLRLSFFSPPFLDSLSENKTISGRIASLKFISSGQEKTISAEKIRQSLGYQKIKSSFFRAELKGNEVHFEGVGSGHGVGMCQWGARHLAQQGKTYREILEYFYPGTQILESAPTLKVSLPPLNPPPATTAEAYSPSKGYKLLD